MHFCITVESPTTQAVKASGRWSVEAEDSEQALVRLLGSDISVFWGKGSTWHISKRCDDCPYRSDSDESRTLNAVYPYHSRRQLLASGRFEA
jgi:hypothetical protein